MAAADSPPQTPRGAIEPQSLPPRLWLVALIVGAVVWIVGAVVTGITGDTIVAPNVIILGTFLVPVCTVLYVLSRPREAHLRAEVLVLGFLAGGTVGVVLTAVTEVYLLPDVPATNIAIGIIEEGGKALIFLAGARLVHPRVPRDGMVLGLTVGAGFAAFESSGYALRALIEHDRNHPILSILETEASRAVLAPFGHITWTAILGGAIFASAWATGRLRIDRRVAWTFVGIVALHAAWDASYGWAIVMSQGLGGDGWTWAWPDTAAWVGTPTGADLVRFQTVYDVLLAINGTIGIVWAIRRWRAYRIDRWSEANASSGPGAAAPRSRNPMIG